MFEYIFNLCVCVCVWHLLVFCLHINEWICKNYENFYAGAAVARFIRLLVKRIKLIICIFFFCMWFLLYFLISRIFTPNIVIIETHAYKWNHQCKKGSAVYVNISNLLIFFILFYFTVFYDLFFFIFFFWCPIHSPFKNITLIFFFVLLFIHKIHNK